MKLYIILVMVLCALIFILVIVVFRLEELDTLALRVVRLEIYVVIIILVNTVGASEKVLVVDICSVTRWIRRVRPLRT